MKFWSKGLGRRCLVVRCGTEEPSVDDGQLVMTGTTPRPLSWSYTMRMDGQDWVEFVRFALRPSVIRHMLARPRFRLALRAGWHMALFVLAVCFALPGVWLRSLAARDGAETAAPSASPTDGDATRVNV